MHDKKHLFLGLLLVVAGIAGGYGQSRDLKIYPEDCRLLPGEDGGYHLFIRKKPGILSVLITSRDIVGIHRRVEQYVYRAWDWNPENGGEVYTHDSETTKILAPWVLLDSTPERLTGFGEAFHIYIPAAIYLYNSVESSPWTTVPVTGAVMVNIRAFNRPGADPGGKYSDNELLIDTDVIAQGTAYTSAPAERMPPETNPSVPAPEPEEISPTGGMNRDFSTGRRIGAAFMNPLLGLGSYTMGDWPGGVIITGGFLVALGLSIWELQLSPDDALSGMQLYGIPGTAALGVAGATVIFGILRPLFYHRPASRNAFAPALDRASIAIIPDSTGVKAVRFGYSVHF
ncbi:hypothetical protein AGMMS50267_08680 [Spirochaetia bacterium]|nr:hypothetical protein AGMMS50267_08680 [Spirochaetia bacterium]